MSPKTPAERPGPRPTPTEVLSTAVHDLRGPLGALAGNVQLLGDGTIDPLSDAQRELVAAIERSADELTRLVGELSTLVNLERRTLPVTMIEATLGSLLESLAPAAAPDAARPAFGAVRGTAGEALLRVDPVLLRQALGAALRGGAAADLEMRHGYAEERPGHVVVLVGRPADVEALARASPDRPRDRTAASRTLGLILARRLVEIHGGCLDETPDGVLVLELPALGAMA